MKLFILKCIKFILFSISILFVVIFIYTYKYNFSLTIPPIKISTSPSYNNKINFCRSKKADIISIGSSMSLNNLSSEIIIKKTKNTSYLNYSSWGMRMSDIYKLLKNISYRPKTLIIASNIDDFFHNYRKIGIEVKENELKSFLKSQNLIYYFFKYFDLEFYLKNCLVNRKAFLKNYNYSDLNYDKYGGVMFDSIKFNINKKRWNENSIVKFNPSINFQYLDSIQSYCKMNKIRLLFFQTPTRSDLLSKKSCKILTSHINSVRSKIVRHGDVFVNSNSIKWENNLFVDRTHLNEKGARIFTEYCFNCFRLRSKL